jgi:hypothetical protein
MSEPSVLNVEMDLPITLDEALERNTVGLYQYRLLILCGFAFMADALEVNLLSFLSVCAGKEWNLSDSDQASITGLRYSWFSFCDLISLFSRGFCWDYCRIRMVGYLFGLVWTKKVFYFCNSCYYHWRNSNRICFVISVVISLSLYGGFWNR